MEMILLTEESRMVRFGERQVEVRIVKRSPPLQFGHDISIEQRTAQMDMVRRLSALPRARLVSFGPGEFIHTWNGGRALSIRPEKFLDGWPLGRWQQHDGEDVAVDTRFLMTMPPVTDDIQADVEALHEAMGSRLPQFQRDSRMVREDWVIPFLSGPDRAIGKLYVPSATPIPAPSEPEWDAG